MTGLITFDRVELLGYDHRFNFWGNAKNYSDLQTFSIRGRLTGDSSAESIANIWRGMSGMIALTRSGASEIRVNNVNLGVGFVRSLSFSESTDVVRKEYTATIEIPRVAGSSLYAGTGIIYGTGVYFQSAGENFINFFSSQTGKYIKDFSFSQSSDIVAQGKYSYNKNCSFSIDSGIYGEFSVSPTTYAKQLMLAVGRSYGQEYVISPEYPNFYVNGSGLSYTNQTFDPINNSYSYSQKFDFQSGLNYLWEYSHSLNLENALVNVDERGKITSSQISGTKIQAALTAWQSIETGIYGRVSSLFTGYTGFLNYTGVCGLYNQPQSSSVSKDACRGTIDYSQSYSNSPFLRTGYQYSYTDEINLDGDGYVTISENGNLKAFGNARPSGFAVVNSGYVANLPEIQSRISGLYSSYTGFFYSCNLANTMNSVSSQETYKEYDAEINYTWEYSSNPKYLGDSVVRKYDTSYSISQPLHIVNYFPIARDSIIAQKANQSTRGVFSNRISVVGQVGATLPSLVSSALLKLQKPSGTDIYISDYGYRYDPFKKSLSMNLDYEYTYYREPEDYLAW